MASSFHEAKAFSDGELKKPISVLFPNVNADRNSKQDAALFETRNTQKNSLHEVLSGK